MMRDVTDVGGGGGFERRFRPTKYAARGLAGIVLAIGATALLPLPWEVKAVVWAFFGWVVLKVVFSVANGSVAFRVDAAGVTLGVVLRRFRTTTVFVPWTDVERIVLWESPTPRSTLPFLTVVRRPDASGLLPAGPEFTGLPSATGDDARTTRPITNWTLDPAALREALQLLAPGVPLVESVLSHRQKPSLLRRFLGGWWWRYVAPIGLAVLLLVCALDVGPDWAAHLGHGTHGTWTVTRIDCGSSCTRQGRFVSSGGTDVRTGVRLAGSAGDGLPVGGALPALDTGSPDTVYPTDGGDRYLATSVALLILAVLLAAWTRTVPLAAWRGRRRRGRAEAAARA
jgi:hypothetical protein